MQHYYYLPTERCRDDALSANLLFIDLYRKANTDNLPLGDASKKRLMEDTEDWHPRTGTSQSRSFRILAQLTGTENGA